MSADFRYMKCPRQTWFLVYTIPPDLRGHPRFLTANGRPMDKITESLNTKDPDKARENRNKRVVYWDRQFRMLRHGPSEEDLREEAIEVYRAALTTKAKVEAENEAARSEYEAAVRAGTEPSDEELYFDALDEAIDWTIGSEIDDYCKRIGISSERGTELYRKIGIEFLKAQIVAGHPNAYLPLPDGRCYGNRYGADDSSLPPLPKLEPPIPVEPKPIASPPPPPKKGAETFAEAAALYLKNELRDDVKPATVQEYRRKIDAFPHKDKPLRIITRGMAAEFLDGLPISKRTRNLYAALFSAIYKSAIRRDKANVNPFEGQRLKGVPRVHYEPFTDDELATLFADAKLEIAPEKHTTATALPWCALIAAFTGCRRDEIASLMAGDIKQTDGIWFFDIRDGKTENAERVVPIRRALIDAGLLKYRDALPRDSRLFPSLKGSPSAPDKTGKALGYAFEAWRKRLGIVREGVNFHSFRHTVGDRLRKAGVAKDDRGFLLGHADVEMQNKVYGHDGPGLRRLKDIVEKIKLPSASMRVTIR
jgi:integrase